MDWKIGKAKSKGEWLALAVAVLASRSVSLLLSIRLSRVRTVVHEFYCHLSSTFSYIIINGDDLLKTQLVSTSLCDSTMTTEPTFLN